MIDQSIPYASYINIPFHEFINELCRIRRPTKQATASSTKDL